MTCLTREAKHETTLKVGALGTGSISSFAPPAPLATSTQLPLPFGASDNESPSIINPLNFGRGSKNADVPVPAKKVKRSEKRIRDKANLDCLIDELDDDDDDFKTDEKVIKKIEVTSILGSFLFIILEFLLVLNSKEISVLVMVAKLFILILQCVSMIWAS